MRQGRRREKAEAARGDADRAGHASQCVRGNCTFYLSLLAVSALIAFLVANLFSVLENNEQLAAQVRTLQSRALSEPDRSRLSLAQSIATAAVVQGIPAVATAPNGARAERAAAARIVRQTANALASVGEPTAATNVPAAHAAPPRPAGGSRPPHPSGGIGWNGDYAALLRGSCGAGRTGTMFVQELVYPRDKFLEISSFNSPGDPNTIKYLLSLNSPVDDAVVSKGILNWMFSPPGTYPSSTEVHTLCTAQPQTASPRWMKKMLGVGGLEEPVISCVEGKVAVEVGSAIGMVSMYLAERGMRVYALDPVLPNVMRLKESACLNGIRHCLQQAGTAHQPDSIHSAAQACRNSSKWGQYSPLNLTLVHAVADRSTGSSRKVRALASNLAATDPKSSWERGSNRKDTPYAADVPTLALDDILEDSGANIELLHMCPQGEEFAVLEGAFRLIKAGRVVNILFGVYYDTHRAREQVLISLSLCVFVCVLVRACVCVCVLSVCVVYA